jgi:hypothetical protein
VPADSRLEPGQPAWIRLSPDRVVEFDSQGSRVQKF